MRIAPAALSVLVSFAPLGLPLAHADHRADFFSNRWEEVGENVESLIRREAPIDGVITFGGDTEFAMQPLPFYRGLALVAVHGGWTPSELVVYFALTDAGELLRLDGTADSLEAIRTSGRLKLDGENIDNYLWFASFFDREDGTPPIVFVAGDDTAYLPDLDTFTGTLGIRLRDAPRAIDCRGPGADGHFRCRATGFWQGRVLVLALEIDDGGELVDLQVEGAAVAVDVDVDAPLNVAEARVPVRDVTDGGSGDRSGDEGDTSDEDEDEAGDGDTREEVRPDAAWSF